MIKRTTNLRQVLVGQNSFQLTKPLWQASFHHRDRHVIPCGYACAVTTSYRTTILCRGRHQRVRCRAMNGELPVPPVRLGEWLTRLFSSLILRMVSFVFISHLPGCDFTSNI